MSDENYKGIWTQGSELYVVAQAFGSVTTEKIMKIEEVEDLTLPEITRNNIDITPIDAKSKRNRNGLAESSESTFTVFLKTDEESHQYFIDLDNDETSDSDISLQFVMGLDDGFGTPPELDASGDLELPPTRTWLTFKGSLKSFGLAREKDNVYKNVAKLEVSGKPQLIRKN